MSDHILKTIDDLTQKLVEAEADVIRMKRTINDLCEMAGQPPRFAAADLSATGAPVIATIRRDTFYGQPLADCIETYLRMRRGASQGPATVAEIYSELERGGYQFSASKPGYAKRGLRKSLTSNALFHRLPDGSYGLAEWYPDAKPVKTVKAEDDDVGDGDEQDADDAEREEEN